MSEGILKTYYYVLCPVLVEHGCCHNVFEYQQSNSVIISFCCITMDAARMGAMFEMRTSLYTFMFWILFFIWIRYIIVCFAICRISARNVNGNCPWNVGSLSYKQ